jgi:hypothetical protein
VEVVAPVPTTAIGTQVPSTAPNRRKQAEIALPVAKRAGGSSPRPRS